MSANYRQPAVFWFLLGAGWLDKTNDCCVLQVSFLLEMDLSLSLLPVCVLDLYNILNRNLSECSRTSSIHFTSKHVKEIKYVVLLRSFVLYDVCAVHCINIWSCLLQFPRICKKEQLLTCLSSYILFNSPNKFLLI